MYLISNSIFPKSEIKKNHTRAADIILAASLLNFGQAPRTSGSYTEYQINDSHSNTCNKLKTA